MYRGFGSCCKTRSKLVCIDIHFYNLILNKYSQFSSGSNYTEPVNNTIVCSEIFQIFHKCTGRFLEVALDTANPFTLCTNKQAFGYYRNLTFFFNLLEENYDKETRIICSEEYLNKNRMSVIGHIVATSKGKLNFAKF